MDVDNWYTDRQTHECFDGNSPLFYGISPPMGQCQNTRHWATYVPGMMKSRIVRHGWKIGLISHIQYPLFSRAVVSCLLSPIFSAEAFWAVYPHFRRTTTAWRHSPQKIQWISSIGVLWQGLVTALNLCRSTLFFFIRTEFIRTFFWKIVKKKWTESAWVGLSRSESVWVNLSRFESIWVESSLASLLLSLPHVCFLSWSNSSKWLVLGSILMQFCPHFHFSEVWR